MLIDIGTVAQSEIGESKDFSLHFPIDLDDAEAKIFGNVTGTVRITKIDTRIFTADFGIKYTITIPCIKCWKDVSIPVSINFQSGFASNSQDDLFLIPPDDMIDLSVPISQEILLRLPMRPLCQQHGERKHIKKGV